MDRKTAEIAAQLTLGGHPDQALAVLASVSGGDPDPMKGSTFVYNRVLAAFREACLKLGFDKPGTEMQRLASRTANEFINL